MKIMNMTLKQVKEYYDSDRCECRCTEGEYCPLHAGNCCLCDIVGFKTDDGIAKKYKTQLGLEFNENLKVRDVINAFIKKEMNQ